jgi:hypothetical protein
VCARKQLEKSRSRYNCLLYALVARCMLRKLIALATVLHGIGSNVTISGYDTPGHSTTIDLGIDAAAPRYVQRNAAKRYCTLWCSKP